MKAMILSDLFNMRQALVQMAWVCVVISFVVSFVSQSPIAGAAAVAAMAPMSFIFGVAAYDEAGGWGAFRMTMPLSRNQVVAGRYASTLVVCMLSFCFALVVSALVLAVAQLCSGMIDAAAVMVQEFFSTSGMWLVLVASALLAVSVMLFASAFATPMIMRYGLTTTTRIAPALFVVVVAVIMVVGGELIDSGTLEIAPLVELLASPASVLGLTVGVFALALVCMGISALVARRFYATREF